MMMTVSIPSPIRAAAAVVRALAVAVLAAILVAPVAGQAAGQTASRDEIKAFLKTTGFDVALDSIALSAGDAPKMLGIDAGAFGSEWTRLTREVFDTRRMRAMALDMLEQTLDADDLAQAVAFYGSDLGQRLVAAENDSHMTEDDAAKRAAGLRLVDEMARADSGRLDLLRRMNRAIDSAGNSVRAIQEIQYRFLLAASAAGVIELKLDPDGLRAMLLRDESRLRAALQESALAGAAYTYQGFNDDELQAYAEALEQPAMQRVYELLNLVQYEIMANRFEALAARMAQLQPGEDI